MANEIESIFTKEESGWVEHPTGVAAEAAARQRADETLESDKQDKLIAGEGITIGTDGKTVSVDVAPLLSALYPVGSLYLSTNETNPQTIFGGTWARFGEGRMLLGANSSHPLGSTGGLERVRLYEDEIPKHRHQLIHVPGATDGGYYPISSDLGGEAYVEGCLTDNTSPNLSGCVERNSSWDSTDKVGMGTGWSSKGVHFDFRHTHGVDVNGRTEETGNNQTHENMPPFVTVNIWQRTA